MKNNLPHCPYCNNELKAFHQQSLVHGIDEPMKQDSILIWVCETCEQNALERLWYGASAFGKYVDVSSIYAYVPLDIVFGKR